MSSDPTDEEPIVTRSDVLARCEYFAQVGIWPPRRTTNPEAWLANFEPDEQEVALALLNAFVFYNEELTDALLLAAIRGLAPGLTSAVKGYTGKRALWIEFLSRTRITHVRAPKDDSDETKSGFLFARKARQLLALTGEQLLPAAEVVAALVAGDDRPVIVVDDFSGTGETFLEGWNRPYDLPSGGSSTFAELVATGAEIYFCPTICTAKARARILALGDKAPFVSAAHILPPEMSVLHPESEVIPAYLRAQVKDVVKAASERSQTAEPPFGYGDLALALSFAHGTPDTTLPIFYCEEVGWTPLVRRR